MSHPDFLINQTDQSGKTLLMESISSANWPIFEMLLECKDVDLNVTNEWGSVMLMCRWRASEDRYLTVLKHPNVDLNITQGNYSCLSIALEKKPEWKKALEYLLEQDSLASQVINKPMYFPPYAVSWAKPLPSDRPMVHPIWALPTLDPNLVVKMLDHPHFQRDEVMNVPIGLRDLYITAKKDHPGLGDCLLQMLSQGAIDPTEELMQIAHDLRHVEFARTLVHYGVSLPRFPDCQFVSRLKVPIPKSAASSLPRD